MKEPYDDGKLYCEDCQSDFILIRNYKEVLNQYTYQKYLNKFRGLGASSELTGAQRPKLQEPEFLLLRQRLPDAIKKGDDHLLSNDENEQGVSKLLLGDVLDEEPLC